MVIAVADGGADRGLGHGVDWLKVALSTLGYLPIVHSYSEHNTVHKPGTGNDYSSPSSPRKLYIFRPGIITFASWHDVQV